MQHPHGCVSKVSWQFKRFIASATSSHTCFGLGILVFFPIQYLQNACMHVHLHLHHHHHHHHPGSKHTFHLTSRFKNVNESMNGSKGLDSLLQLRRRRPSIPSRRHGSALKSTVLALTAQRVCQGHLEKKEGIVGHKHMFSLPLGTINLKVLM